MDLPQKTTLIILDRDGVINYDSDDYIKSPKEWIPIPGSLEAITHLNQAGYKVAIATNQSGIARRYYDVKTLTAMHLKMQRLLADIGGEIHHIAFCPHGPTDNCPCRKPKPEMLLAIAAKFSTHDKNCIFVGDTATDMQAAKAANMPFVLVKTGKGERTIASLDKADNDNILIYNSLADFVKNFLTIRY